MSTDIFFFTLGFLCLIRLGQAYYRNDGSKFSSLRGLLAHGSQELLAVSDNPTGLFRAAGFGLYPLT
jgi:hypothetical protein